ncbi:MAG: mechanosensitive ion channel [Alphaproteobacteria bacterium]|nr:mechanosensitive ion channel [Alphaproteobacteria bacterium]
MNVLDISQAQVERQVSQMVEAVMAVIAGYGLSVIGAILILIFGWLAAGWMSNGIMRAFGKSPRVDQTLVTFAASTARYAVLTFTIIAVLSSVGVQTTSFVAVLGALGLAVGLALQGTLNHVASGVLLIMFRPFKVGDAIEAAGVSGVVKAITLFTTEIATADNVKVIVPNGTVWGGTIRNLTAHPTRAVTIDIPIAHANDIDRALSLAVAELASDARLLKEPAPGAAVARVTDASVTVSAVGWVKTADLAPAKADLSKAIKARFDREGIAPPAATPRPA